MKSLKSHVIWKSFLQISGVLLPYSFDRVGNALCKLSWVPYPGLWLGFECEFRGYTLERDSMCLCKIQQCLIWPVCSEMPLNKPTNLSAHLKCIVFYLCFNWIEFVLRFHLIRIPFKRGEQHMTRICKPHLKKKTKHCFYVRKFGWGEGSLFL